MAGKDRTKLIELAEMQALRRVQHEIVEARTIKAAHALDHQRETLRLRDNELTVAEANWAGAVERGDPCDLLFSLTGADLVRKTDAVREARQDFNEAQAAHEAQLAEWRLSQAQCDLAGRLHHDARRRLARKSDDQVLEDATDRFVATGWAS